MTKGLGVRQYRACVRCRARKIRCDLQSIGEQGKPPCAKCIREGADCILAGSRRGGDYSHLRRPRQQPRLRKTTPSPPVIVHTPASDHVSPRKLKSDNLQNPSDALLILAHAAEQPDQEEVEQGSTSNDGTSEGWSLTVPGVDNPASFGDTIQVQPNVPTPEQDQLVLSGYPLIADGILDMPMIASLLQHYAENYHPFLPVASAVTLQPEHIIATIENESFLLTAILVVASQHRPHLLSVHDSIWRYMRELILNVVLGMKNVRRVGCVEGLLLLGEWTPQGQTTDDGEGAAWSITGLAVRLAYLLRLEDSSFKGPVEEDDKNMARSRLAWTFTYLSDRQISIRMGQAFWCRGPSLSARFTAQDFPTLQPKMRGDEDYASLLQAQVELTTLFGNAHDILFASRSRTAELMIRGDYSKYLDDTARAMAAWQHSWKSINVSAHLRSCLSLTYEYLRLYVNAFAFQAVLYRSSAARNQDLTGSKAPIMFPDSTMASPDARPIYEAIDAAETMVKIVINEIHPEAHFRYLPTRYYLYEIHSSVFLYKAYAVGAITPTKYNELTDLMRRFITCLRAAAAVDGDHHVASRFADLLDQLWFYHSRSVGASLSGGQTGSGQDNCETDYLPRGSGDSSEVLLSNPIVASAGVGNGNGQQQVPLYDEIGLPAFDCADPIDALFAMPFTMDQTGFLGYGP